MVLKGFTAIISDGYRLDIRYPNSIELIFLPIPTMKLIIFFETGL